MADPTERMFARLPRRRGGLRAYTPEPQAERPVTRVPVKSIGRNQDREYDPVTGKKRKRER